MGKYSSVSKSLARSGVKVHLAIIASALVLGCMAPQIGRAQGASAAATSNAECHGDASFAGLPGEPPTYWFPMYQPAFWDTGYVPWASYLMWRPLYWWGNGSKPVYNPKLSLAESPVWSQTSDGHTVATITLKNLTWSTGRPITTRDVEFWINLLKANKVNWAPYTPGTFPDNIQSIKYINDKTFKIVFNGKYNHTWLLGDELNQITPIPQFAWDKTSLSGPVGDYDRTEDGAKKVYEFLQTQAKTPDTFATNPLWQVVDGPFAISAYDTGTHKITWKANKRYSWDTPKPHLCTFTTVPFTSQTAEVNALLTSKLDVGYVPFTSLNLRKTLERKGYKIGYWYQDAFAGLIINYSPKNVATPILSKLYIRQVLTHLTPMKVIQKKIYHGLAYYSPSPIASMNGHGAYVTKADQSSPYPYDPKKASAILAAHGWHVVPNGETFCEHPGTGSGQCGEGINKDAKLVFRTIATESTPRELSLIQLLKSSYSQVGIRMNLKTVPDAKLPDMASLCALKDACPWDLELWMGEWPLGWTTNVETGGPTFKTGSSSNFLHLSNKENDRLIENIYRSEDIGKATEEWENFMIKNQFQIFLPIPVYRVVAYKAHLQGVPPFDPYLQINPERWYFDK